MDQRLPKIERLSRRSDIQRLFTTGEALLAYPVKVTFRPGNGLGWNRVMVMAPKRNLKRAVDRNRIKRRLREAYRLHKHLFPAALGDKKGGGWDLALSYVPREGKLLEYREIEEAVVKLLQKLARQR